MLRPHPAELGPRLKRPLDRVPRPHIAQLDPRLRRAPTHLDVLPVHDLVLRPIQLNHEAALQVPRRNHRLILAQLPRARAAYPRSLPHPCRFGSTRASATPAPAIPVLSTHHHRHTRAPSSVIPALAAEPAPVPNRGISTSTAPTPRTALYIAPIPNDAPRLRPRRPEA